MFWCSWLLTCKLLVTYCVIECIACYVCLLLQKFYTRVSVNYYEVVFKAVIYKGLGLWIFPFMTLGKYPSISIISQPTSVTIVTALTVFMQVLLNYHSLCLTFQRTVLCNFLYKCQMVKLKAMWKKIWHHRRADTSAMHSQDNKVKELN